MSSGSNVLDRLDAFTVGGIGHRGDPGTTGQPWAELVTRAARSSCTILITGETGAGKEHLARWIHGCSSRCDRGFVPVNCGAIPESVIDSQLFGHERGAFTGATSEHLGLVRAAEGGSLFLDEISELPPTAQTRLLRLLQEGEVQPVGRSSPVIADVRVIAATNRDLQAEVAERRFRADLLFRLDVVQLRVKPLRERPDELPLLLDAFNREFAATYEQSPLDWDAKALQILRGHPWPGNIRQLRSLVERLHVLCPGQRITSGHLRDICRLFEGPPLSTPVHSLRQVKSDAVRRVLADAGGSVAKAAEIFGVHRSTIYRWLRDIPTPITASDQPAGL